MTPRLTARAMVRRPRRRDRWRRWLTGTCCPSPARTPGRRPACVGQMARTKPSCRYGQAFGAGLGQNRVRGDYGDGRVCANVAVAKLEQDLFRVLRHCADSQAHRTVADLKCAAQCRVRAIVTEPIAMAASADKTPPPSTVDAEPRPPFRPELRAGARRRCPAQSQSRRPVPLHIRGR